VKIASPLRVAFIVFVLLASSTYFFLNYLRTEQTNRLIACEVEDFSKQIEAIKNHSFDLSKTGLILLASDFFKSHPFIGSKNHESKKFLSLNLQSILHMLHINLIKLHLKNPQDSLEVGIDKNSNSDLRIYQNFLQQFEVEKGALVLKNTFFLKDFDGIEQVEFSIPLLNLLYALENFNEGFYDIYIPQKEFKELEHFQIGLFKDAFKSANIDFNLLPAKIIQELEEAIKNEKSYGFVFEHEKKPYLFIAFPISIQNSKGATYVIKIASNDELNSIETFYQYYFLLAVLFIGLFAFFGHYVWEQKRKAQLFYDDLAIQKASTEALFEQVAAGIGKIDQNGGILQANEKFARLLGISKIDATKYNFYEIVGQSSAFMREFMTNKKRGNFVHKFKNLQNKEIEIDTMASKQDECMSLVCISREEKRVLEKALKRLNLYFNHSNLGYMILDKNNTIVDTNETIFDVTGYRKKELLNQSAKILFVNQEMYELWSQNYAQGCFAKNDEPIEFKLKRKNGIIFWVEMYKNIFEDGGQSLSIWSLRDISNRVRSRDMIQRLNNQLIAQYNELEAILDVIPMPIYIKDANLKYKGCNRSYCNFFNKTKGEILGRRAEQIFPKEFCELVDKKEAFLEKKSYQSFRSTYYDAKNNEEKILEFHKKTIYKDKEFNGIVGVVVDITQNEKQKSLLAKRVKEEVEKNIKNLKLHQEERIKSAQFSTIGKMAAGITHEINTPLTYVKGNVELLAMDIKEIEDKKLRQSAEQNLKVILEGLNRIGNIIESMREVSQANKESKENVNLFETIVNALIVSSNRSKHISKIYLNGALFNLDFPKNKELFTCKAQRQRIEQVWIILISNALDELVKIEPFEKRFLDIKIWEEKDGIFVRFSDNAGGIDPKILPKIFEPFVSAKKSSGIGIGLNIARNIIQDHKGKIRAFNSDVGAVFEIFLPKK
jgi:PAS domain S-box-containing protein